MLGHLLGKFEFPLFNSLTILKLTPKSISINRDFIHRNNDILSLKKSDPPLCIPKG